MTEAERRSQPYLFKLRRSRVKSWVKTLCAPETDWVDAGEGWQSSESRMKLTGWKKKRRCIFLRRPAKKTPVSEKKTQTGQLEFEFTKDMKSLREWEYVVLATNDEMLTPWTITLRDMDISAIN